MLGFLEAGLGWRHGRWLRSLARRDPTLYGSGEPLFFHHVAKTGGTSLIKALRGMTLPELAFSEDGNLSANFVNRLIARGLTPGQLIYGHPLPGAASPLRGRCCLVTLLRDPCHQVISNYLHVRKNRTVPDHALARQTGLREFLLARPYFVIFQTASLHVGIENKPLNRAEDLIDRLPAIIAYLDDFSFLGTIETADRLLADLAQAMGWTAAPRFPHRRRSRVSQHHRNLMNEQLAELHHHPELAPLFAAEREVYNKARAIEASRQQFLSARPHGNTD